MNGINTEKEEEIIEEERNAIEARLLGGSLLLTRHRRKRKDVIRELLLVNRKSFTNDRNISPKRLGCAAACQDDEDGFDEDFQIEL